MHRLGTVADVAVDQINLRSIEPYFSDVYCGGVARDEHTRLKPRPCRIGREGTPRIPRRGHRDLPDAELERLRNRDGDSSCLEREGGIIPFFFYKERPQSQLLSESSGGQQGSPSLPERPDHRVVHDRQEFAVTPEGPFAF